jgi:hypothetical protein
MTLLDVFLLASLTLVTNIYIRLVIIKYQVERQLKHFDARA